MHLHVFDVKSQVHGELQMQVPDETVLLHTKFAMFLSHAMTGVAAKLHVAPQRPTLKFISKYY